MKTLTAALLASAFAFPALAQDAFSTGDSHGPRQPHAYTADSYSGTGLDEQIAETNHADRESYDRVVANGGCNADFVPFWIAEHCNEKAFGKPMGSEGN
jgi:hypothetical protein